MSGIDRPEPQQHLAEPPLVDPSAVYDQFPLNHYEQAGLLALLRSLELEGHRFARAAEYLRWTFECHSGVQVFDEGVDANVDGYVRWCDIEAEGF